MTVRDSAADADDATLLANPQFHAQNVYAVADLCDCVRQRTGRRGHLPVHAGQRAKAILGRGCPRRPALGTDVSGVDLARRAFLYHPSVAVRAGADIGHGYFPKPGEPSIAVVSSCTGRTQEEAHGHLKSGKEDQGATGRTAGPNPPPAAPPNRSRKP